jgi:O-acetyl-ADP-ribose deacetylase (regulator of RNase III)
MIKAAHGNLLLSEAEALVNTVNTVGIMGKGIALQFKRAYPDMFAEYERAAKMGQLRLGEMSVWENSSLTGPKFIINFPTKRRRRSPSRLPDIEAGLVDLVRVIETRGIKSVAIPPLGCGHGGLNWRDVEALIVAAMATLPEGVDVFVYPPEGAPPSEDMVDRRTPPPLTPARAALIKLLRNYENFALHDTSLIEVQKLVYFLQLAGQDLRLNFVKGRYGPYSDSIRKTLRDMEGHFIVGFGDGSASVLSAEPLRVMPDVVSQADAVLANDAEVMDRVRRVMALTDGFDSTYGLELLATVYWVAHDINSRDTEAIYQDVQRWTQRKAELFTRDHIVAAIDQLDKQSWLTTIG